MPQESLDQLIRQYQQELLRYQSRSTAPPPPAVPEPHTPAEVPPASSAPKTASPPSAPPEPIAPPEPEIQHTMPPDPVPLPENPAEPPAADAPSPFSPLAELLQCRDDYTDSGELRVAVTTARQALPLPGAAVVIYCLSEGKPRLKYVLTTDASGRTPFVPLPAPPAANSGAPGSLTPYALYGVSVHKSGYRPERQGQVQVFPGVSGTVSFDLIPAAAPPERG